MEETFGHFSLQNRNPQFGTGEYSRTFLLRFENYVNLKALDEFAASISQLHLLYFLSYPEFLTGEIMEANPDPFLIYPNPASENITILPPENFTFKNTKFILRDITGKEILLKEIPSTESNYTFSVKEIPVGVYMLEVRSGNEFFTKQISVIR